MYDDDEYPVCPWCGAAICENARYGAIVSECPDFGPADDDDDDDGDEIAGWLTPLM